MKGQSGINTGIIIILVTLSIVLYVLLLPPDIREELLGEPGEGISSGTVGTTILDVNPGRIDQTILRDRIHSVPSFRIQIQEKPEIIKSLNSLRVVNSAFTKESKTVSFELDSRNTQDLILSFNVAKADGRLIILHNNQEIMNTELSEGSITPIPLDITTDYNELVFYTNNPGLLFFLKNEYGIENVQISARVKDVSTSSAKNSFAITPTEFSQIDSARLRYFANCVPSSVGTLYIYVNNLPLFEGKADCGFSSEIDIDTAILNEGINNIEFSSDKGSYIIDRIEVRTSTAGEMGSQLYYFSLKDNYFDGSNLRSGNDVYVQLTFTDDDSSKTGDIIINGDRFSFRTNADFYERKINTYITRSSNSIEVDPEGRLNIARLKIVVK